LAQQHPWQLIFPCLTTKTKTNHLKKINTLALAVKNPRPGSKKKTKTPCQPAKINQESGTRPKALCPVGKGASKYA
jgi:hypothetical protein